MTDDLHELSGLYALGALRGEERARFEAHLETCEHCRAEVRSFSPVVDALSHVGRVVEPPLALRARVLNLGTPEPKNLNLGTQDRLRQGFGGQEPRNRGTQEPRTWMPWLAAAAAVIAAVAAGVYASQLRARIDDLQAQLAAANFRAAAAESQMADARRDVERTSNMLGVLVAPDMARVDLKGQGAASSAAGRAYWSRARGLVFTATNLPPLPAGRIYQLWVVTPTTAVDAGLLRPDDQGRVTTVVATDPAIAPVAMAVTIEPEGGVPAPTGEKYLIGMVAP